MPRLTTMGGVYIAAMALGALLLVGMLRSVLARRQEGEMAWRTLWVLPVALALIVSGALLLARQHRLAEAAAHVAKAKELKDSGLTGRAQRELERALKLNPKNTEAEKTLRDIEKEEQERREVEKQRTQRIPTAKGGGGGRGPAPRLREQPRAGIDVDDYRLAVTLHPKEHRLEGTATILARPRDADARELTLLLGPSLIISSVQVDDKAASFTTDEDRLIIKLPGSPPQERPIKIVVAYDGFGQGPGIPGGDRIAEDGCFLRPESQWYPATHLFDFKTPVTLAVTVPAKMTVVGPGKLVQRKKRGAQTTFVWRCKLPIRGIVMAAAKYSQRRSTWHGIDLSVCTFPEHADRAARYFHSVTGILEYFGEQFGSYPFSKFALVEIPQFPGGYAAPSFVLCYDKVIQRGDVDEGFIAHEIAHQWWGHAVGVDGPGAAWLSEGFAEYSSCMYEAHARGPEAMRLRLKAAREKYIAAVGAGREQAIADTDPFYQVGGYPGVIYHKGAYVLHMLHTVLGDEMFSKCMTDYALAYRGRSATISDFENACTRTAGTPLDWFFDQWVYQPGAMRLTYDHVSKRVAGGKHRLRIAVQQETKAPYRMPLDIAVKTRAGEVRRREMLDAAVAQYEYHLDSQPVAVTLDPDGNLLMYTPSKVRIDALRSKGRE